MKAKRYGENKKSAKQSRCGCNGAAKNRKKTNPMTRERFNISTRVTSRSRKKGKGKESNQPRRLRAVLNFTEKCKKKTVGGKG